MTIHDFDMARFLMGDEVEEIYTSAGVMVDPAIGKAGDLDTALILMCFATVSSQPSTLRKAVYGYDQRVRSWQCWKNRKSAIAYPNQAIVSNGSTVHRDLPLNFFMERYTESFALELKSFTQAVLEGKPTLVTGIDGRIPVVMALAARKSYDENRRYWKRSTHEPTYELTTLFSSYDLRAAKAMTTECVRQCRYQRCCLQARLA